MSRGGPVLAERGGPGNGETDTGSFSIVAVDAFVRATRDSGYKGTPSAVAELLDNALQAGARVNLEIDLIARYVERMLGSAAPKAA